MHDSDESNASQSQVFVELEVFTISNLIIDTIIWSGEQEYISDFIVRCMSKAVLCHSGRDNKVTGRLDSFDHHILLS